jgi:Arc/MetJ-type ribon-helix-helix transcriptional regulator
MVGMKLSVSLPEKDIQFMDRYAETHEIENRSAVLRTALKLLREGELAAQYRAAYTEWHESGEDEVWEVVVGDGIAPEARSDAQR